MPLSSADLVAAQIRRYYELVDQNDVGDIVGLFAENAVYERPGYPTIVGREQLDDFYRSVRMIDQGRHTVGELLVNAGQAFAEGVFAGTLKDGRVVDVRFADFFAVDDKLLISFRRTYFYAPMV